MSGTADAQEFYGLRVSGPPTDAAVEASRRDAEEVWALLCRDCQEAVGMTWGGVPYALRSTVRGIHAETGLCGWCGHDPIKADA